MNESYPTKLKSFQRKIVQMGALQVAKFHTNPSNFVACLPNPYKLYFGWYFKSYHFVIFLL